MNDLKRISEKQQAAIDFAKRGWAVFPVHAVHEGCCNCGNSKCGSPGKHPMTGNGFKDATTDPQHVEQSWETHPDANIGIRTGKESGVFVLDIDPDHGGHESLAELRKEFGELPHTVIAETGGGGQHYFFEYSEEEIRNRNALRRGIDIRGEGGYVVAPPSRHVKGTTYRWREGCSPDGIDLARAPNWLVDLIQRREPSTNRKSADAEPPQTEPISPKLASNLHRYVAKCEGVAEGERNSQAFTIACKLREISKNAGNDLTSDAIFDLLSPWNHRNSPPLDGVELRKICESASSRELQGLCSTSNASSPKGGRDSTTADLKSSDALLPYKPFPIDVLPDPVAKYIEQAANSIGCHNSFVALPLLTVFAAAIGNSRRVQLKEGWKEPPILWTVIVGDSGSAKSPALGVALAPFENLQNKAAAKFKTELKEFKRQEIVYKEDLRIWRMEQDSLLPPAEPEPPILEHYYCEDATIESLIERLMHSQRGTLVARDELVGWIKSFDQYKSSSGGDIAHWLKIHGGRQLKVDRKTGYPPTIIVPHACVSVTGGIQPLILKSVLTEEHTESGLAARLLFAMPPRKAKRWTDEGITEEATAEMMRLINSLYILEMNSQDDGQLHPKVLTLTPEAKEAYVNFYNRHNQQQLELCGAMGAAWSKLEGYAARLALVVHCVREALSGDLEKFSEQIDFKSMQAALKLVEWFGYEAQRLYGRMVLKRDGERIQSMVDWIRNQDGPVTVRQVQRGRKECRSSEDAEDALKELVDAGLGEWRHQPSGDKGGRPTQTFVLFDHSASIIDAYGIYEEINVEEQVASDPSKLTCAC